MSHMLPLGWVNTTLGELITPKNVRIHPSDYPDLPYVGLEHVESHTMRLMGHAKGSEVRSSVLRFNRGDILYGRLRPYLNKVWVADFDGLCSAEFIVFPGSDALDSDFLAFLLSSEAFATFASGHVSGERPRVRFNALQSFKIRLPPTAEQSRIGNKLAELRSRLSSGEAAVARALERLDRYKSAVLHAAVNGELTVAWREMNTENELVPSLADLLMVRRKRWEKLELTRRKSAGKSLDNDQWKAKYPTAVASRLGKPSTMPNDWAWATLDQLSILFTSGSRGWSKYYGKGQGVFILAQNVRNEGLDLSFKQHVDPPPTDPERIRTQVERLDLLVTIVGSNTGDVCIVPKALPHHFVSQSVSLIRLAEPRYARFIWRYLSSDLDGQHQWRAMVYGAGRPHLSLDHLRSTSVPLPSLGEQNQINHEIETRFAAAALLRTRLLATQRKAQEQWKVLLEQAFSGTLLPQDPNDEPASKVIEKVRQQTHTRYTEDRIELKPMKSRHGTRKDRTIPEILADHPKGLTPEALFRLLNYKPEQVDDFYQHLVSYRNLIVETKPSPANVKTWPYGAEVILKLKGIEGKE